MRNRVLRFLTMAAALSLLLTSVPLTGGAADSGTTQNETTVFTAEYTEPEVRVVVPTTGEIFINPYENPVYISSAQETGQIVSVPSSIANLSRMPLQVDVTVSGRVLEGSDMILSSTTTKDTESTTKKAFMYFEMKNVDAALAKNPASVEWDGTYNEDSDIVVSTTTRKTKENVVTLAAAGPNGEASPGGAAAFHLDGDAVRSPKNAWTEKDGVQVTVSFSFKPLPCS